MKTLLSIEAANTQEMSAAVKQQLLDLNVKLRTQVNPSGNIETPKQHKLGKKTDLQRPNYLLRLL